MATTFAVRLRELREKAGISQADLAFRSGIHPQSVAKLEQGSRDPGFFTVKAIAEALGTTVLAFNDTVPSSSADEGSAQPPGAKPGPGRPRKTQPPAESDPEQPPAPVSAEEPAAGKARGKKGGKGPATAAERASEPAELKPTAAKGKRKNGEQR